MDKYIVGYCLKKCYNKSGKIIYNCLIFMISQQRLFKTLGTVSYVLLAANIILVPLFLDKDLVNFYIIPKQYVMMGLLLLNLLVWVTKIVLGKKVHLRRTVLDLPILALLASGLLSCVFSAARGDSFVGRSEYFTFSFVFLLFSILFYYLLVDTILTPARWRGLLDVLILIGNITTVFFLFRVFFNFGWLQKLTGNVWNLTDGANAIFSLWLTVIMILCFGLIIKKTLPFGRSLYYFISGILAYVILVTVSFKMLWWVMILGLVLLLVLGVSFIREARLSWLSVLFSLLVLTIIFLVFGTPKNLQTTIPAEISLGAKASWVVAYKNSFSDIKNFFFGRGLGQFGTAFSLFRTANFNNDSLAWSLRFNQGNNNLLNILTEGGVIFMLAMVFVFLVYLGHVLQLWFKMRFGGVMHNLSTGMVWQKEDVRFEAFLVAVALVTLTFAGLLLSYGMIIWWFWWLLLGLSVTCFSFFNPHFIYEKEWKVEDTPQYSLAFSFGMILIMAVVVMIGVWGARVYLAEIDYAAALKQGNYSVMEQKLNTALARRDNVDNYHLALAQVYLLQAIDMSKSAQPNVAGISEQMAKAVNEAKKASDISPRSVTVLETLATMYENAAVLLPEARDWAIKTLSQAKDLEPTNAVLWWRLGNNYLTSGKIEDAIKNYQQSIQLKNNYVASYLSLASAYEQNNQLDKAVETIQTVFLAGANNVEVFYNYGRLLYNRNGKDDRKNAEILWKKVLEIQPNYSNALYSLGLLNETRGDKVVALQYYYKVKDLNPENKDIVKKIQALLGGN